MQRPFLSTVSAAVLGIAAPAAIAQTPPFEGPRAPPVESKEAPPERMEGKLQSPAGAPARRLDLTHAQIEIIRRGVGGNALRFEYAGDLEVGIDLPSDIAVAPLPDPVVRQVPEVRSHRYALIEDEIAIVSPDRSEVVFVIAN